MSVWSRVRPGRLGRWFTGLSPRGRVGVAAVMVPVLVASLLSGVPAQARPASEPGVPRLAGQTERVDTVGGEVAGKGWKTSAVKSAALPAPVWPEPGKARVDLTTAASSSAWAAAEQAAAGTVGRGVKAAGLPVWVDQTVGKSDKAGAARLAAVDVEVLDRAKVPAGWRDGLLVSLSPAATTKSGSAGSVRVSVDYSGFRWAVGGGWASRLRLWQLPECALSTPALAGCRPRMMATANDVKTGVVSAQVQMAAPTVLAVAAAASGSDGDFTATSLSASSTWSAGGNSGDFSWSYPLRTPPGPAELAPSIALSYSSSSVDGRSEATNNQPSWIGEGFDYSPGFIERAYVPCGQDMADGANNTVKTGDLCWRSDNATMSLSGRGGELVFEAGKGWHARSEDGSKIEKLTGAGNGDNDGEYWKVTTTDGTQYFFGRHGLPGQSAVTNSAWTVPVFGNHVGEPCHEASFSGSDCAQAWRWNLDYVVDVHGNTTSYWYERETNQYARNVTDTDNVSYVRGGVLTRIDYGTYWRTSAEHGVAETSTSPVGQVLFTTSDRCLSSCWTGSDPTVANWPDTPWDQYCKPDAGECVGMYSPTFWSTKRLAKITTRVWDTTKATAAWQEVDSWTLSHAFPNPGDGTNAGLWLNSITHSGLVGGTVSLPVVSFEPVSMPNRVLTAHNTTNNWLRVSNIISETGGKTHVDYSLPECVDGSLPAAAHTNTKRCYPVITEDWSADPTGEVLMTEWWHKYRVEKVIEQDVPLADGHQSVSKFTSYEYVGSPAWHYADDDGLIRPDRKTWSQFRGWSTVKTRVGEDPDTQTLTVATFLRGMHGDRAAPSGGTRTVTVPASLGDETVYDEDQFAGMVREQEVFNGVESRPVSKTVMVPWRSVPTATRTINGDVVQARFTDTRVTYSATALGVDGVRGWRTTKTWQEFDDTYGMVVRSGDDGDVAVAGDEKCVTYTYNRNTGKNIVTTVAQSTTMVLACGEAPASADDVLADVRYFYDGATSTTTAPVYGDVTRIDQLKDWTVTDDTLWQTMSQATFDSTGRPATTTDVKGNITRLAYTPAVGGPVTKVTSTNPLNWVSTVEVNPYWGSTVKITDANSKVTAEVAYDGLGRVWKVWSLGWPRAGNEDMPSAEYTYTFATNRDAYPFVKTRALTATGSYVSSYQIFDGLLRARQSQAPSANGDGSRVVVDTIYDKAGRAATAYGAHVEPDAPSGVLWWEPEWSVPAVTKTVFDRVSRPVASVFYTAQGETNLVERWRTSSAYEGDLTKTTPPAGGVPTTTVVDADGRTVALRQHITDAGVGGAYQETRYEYDRKDRLASVVDPKGNRWGYGYDVKGRQIQATDPDKGTTTSQYNDYDELVKTVDARGEALWFVYDKLGRKTQVRDDSASGALRSLFKYDTLYIGASGFRGQLTQAIRYEYEPSGSTNVYKWQVSGFDGRYQPSGINYVIPDVETGLGATYGFTYGYSPYTGAPLRATYPPAGDLVTETVTTDYDAVTGLPVRLGTNRIGETGTMAATWYSPYGETTLTTLKMPGGLYVDNSVEREEGTRRVVRDMVKPETAAGTVTDRAYSYDDVGNILSIADTPQVGVADQQCFRYDRLARLSAAWTPKAGVNCGTDPTVADLMGGSSAYWHEWTFDEIGNRLTQTAHDVAGDTTTTYEVPPSGPESVRPHALTSTSTTAPGQSALVQEYDYDATGNTVCRPTGTTTGNDCPAGSASQELVWDAEGRLAQVKTGTTPVETNVYDANGARLIRRDATGTTLFLPGQEVRHQNGTTTATRYYSLNGSTIASRSGSGLTWLLDDHQGTAQTAVAAGTQAVTVRRQTPYGAVRGTDPAWPNPKGFVGGDNDPTGLTHLGARDYDPGVGRFISVDPIMDLVDPAQWNGYAYANNNPTTLSDPDGLIPADCMEHDCYGYGEAPNGGCPYGCGSTKNVDWGEANGKTSTKPKQGPPTVNDFLATPVPGGAPNSTAYALSKDGNFTYRDAFDWGAMDRGNAAYLCYHILGLGDADCHNFYDKIQPGKGNSGLGEALAVLGVVAVAACVIIGPECYMPLASAAGEVAVGAGEFAASGSLLGAAGVGGVAGYAGYAGIAGLGGRSATDVSVALRDFMAKRAGFSGSGQRYILDENMSPRLARELRDLGYNVRGVGEMGLNGTKDPQLNLLAQQLGARVITRDRGRQLDGGFGDLAVNIDRRVTTADGIARILKGE